MPIFGLSDIFGLREIGKEKFVAHTAEKARILRIKDGNPRMKPKKVCGFCKAEIIEAGKTYTNKGRKYYACSARCKKAIEKMFEAIDRNLEEKRKVKNRKWATLK